MFCIFVALDICIIQWAMAIPIQFNILFPSNITVKKLNFFFLIFIIFILLLMQTFKISLSTHLSTDWNVVDKCHFMDFKAS